MPTRIHAKHPAALPTVAGMSNLEAAEYCPTDLNLMNPSNLNVRKEPFELRPDSRRVITRMLSLSDERVGNVVSRVLKLPEAEVRTICADILEDFGQRHKSISSVLLRHYNVAVNYYLDDTPVNAMTEERKLLIGAYLTMEYAIESAALFNPSITPHPDQSNLPEGAIRVVVSLRAVGEGHISSIEFRSAVLGAKNDLAFDPISRYVVPAAVYPDRNYNKHLFSLKLFDMALVWEPSALDGTVRMVGKDIIEGVLNRLGKQFTMDQLRWFMGKFRAEYKGDRTDVLEEVYDRMMFLARSNYQIRFSEETELSERVIFPYSSTEEGGIEDARFVQLIEEDGEVIYYATYTAYDGKHILTQLMETPDFQDFKIHTLNGKFSQSKGMALFPRRINGKYAMVSRIDGENLYLMYSDNTHFWDNAKKIQAPTRYWELTQIGNCGSPIETEAGWILLTHGVGPMRRYSIGALLLDRDDPSKVIGELRDPLLAPIEEERDGYVPNVVYTCGALAHNGELIIPYAVSDTASRVAIVPLDELLSALTN